MTAAQRWRAALAEWAIPQEILSQAPESPWAHPTSLFTVDPDAAIPETPSATVAREAIPAEGSVLDVGCGGGAAALALADRVGLIVGVDGSAEMLAAFAAAAEHVGVAHREVLGMWPQRAGQVPTCDVVVCHHVLYNIADLPPFVAALDNRANERVVIEIPQRHPTSPMNPLWERFWGIVRPLEPTADDAVAVLHEMGIEPQVARFSAPARRLADPAAEARRARIHLCLPEEREPEVAAALNELGAPVARDLVTLWWRPATS